MTGHIADGIEALLRALGESEPQADQPSFPVCKRCGQEVAQVDERGLCSTCAEEAAHAAIVMQRGFEISRMTGRRRNGAERDGGGLWHARLVDESGNVSWRAACGAQPGRHSDWSDYTGKEVTCLRCRRKLERLGLWPVADLPESAGEEH